MRNDASTRTTSLAAAATTLMALVAMGAVIPMSRGLALAEVALARNEAGAVRAVVAAVARDLLAVPTPTMPAPAMTEPSQCRPDPRAVVVSDRTPATPRRLAARLLDLPPPAC